MNQATAAPVYTVDADGHVSSNRAIPGSSTWSRATASVPSASITMPGHEVLLIDGKSLEAVHGRLAALGGVEMDPAALLETGRYNYEVGCPPGSYDPAARLAVLDEEGIDTVLLYPTIGICWEGHVQDAGLAHAYTEAYNRWLVDFCSHAPRRLNTNAHLNQLDVELAVKEIRRARGRRLPRDLYLAGHVRPRAATLRRPALDRFGRRRRTRHAGRFPRRRA